eukprot:TRINITY_DN70197_c0_g1_i1.p1 TRINITY_DN70197_c0_g1~~TRINITY_DN70197_c0_g1_i1.p1  ORF type:complete len:701 (-),score=82.57 TRINITY_DN70197_c0_g1_i1:225-2057(-)
MTHRYFDLALAAIIISNMFLTIAETDALSSSTQHPSRVVPWMRSAAHIYCLIYSVEIVCKIYIYQRSFATEPWNNIDGIIVVVDLVMLTIGLLGDRAPHVAFLRTLRLVRLLRAFRAMRALKELDQLLQGFLGALRAIFFGLIMIMVILSVWGILAVQFINPIVRDVVETSPEQYEGCPRCPRAFRSVLDSVVTLFFLTMTGDSWGDLTAPVIELEYWTFFFFLGVLVTVHLVMLNLILAVIVQAAMNASAGDVHQEAIQAEIDRKRAEDSLLTICSEIDIDGDGMLTIDEFLNGFHANKKFRDSMTALHVTDVDLPTIFNIVDEDCSGRVSYLEFVTQLRRMQMQMPQMILHQLSEVRDTVHGMGVELLGSRFTDMKGRQREQRERVARSTFCQAARSRTSQPDHDVEASTKPPRRVNTGPGQASTVSGRTEEQPDISEALVRPLLQLRSLRRSGQVSSGDLKVCTANALLSLVEELKVLTAELGASRQSSPSGKLLKMREWASTPSGQEVVFREMCEQSVASGDLRGDGCRLEGRCKELMSPTAGSVRSVNSVAVSSPTTWSIGDDVDIHLSTVAQRDPLEVDQTDLNSSRCPRTLRNVPDPTNRSSI